MYLICTPIPYVNGTPHLGHILEAIFNDTIARYQRRKMNQEVVFQMGLDQHGLKVYKKSQELEIEIYKYIEEESQKFLDLWDTLEISHNQFIQTSSEKHKALAQVIWKVLASKNLIYKKTFEGLYCVGDEAFYSKSQLREGGLCPNHDEYPIKMQEENYFFKLSQFEDVVKEFLNTTNIIPSSTRKEWLNFVEAGLEDISFSREKTNLPWGVPVPNDPKQVMYVWFEALINYLTAIVDPELLQAYLEFPKQEDEFIPKILADLQDKMPINFHFMGKDMPKFHFVIWVAILEALSFKKTENNFVHGFINDSQGRKMSKSLGNGIAPSELLEKFGVDGTRFVILHEINHSSDSNFDWGRVIDSYNANLANNLGNALMRVSTLIQKNLDGYIDLDNFDIEAVVKESKGVTYPDIDINKVYLELEKFEPNQALKNLLAECSKLNVFLEETAPWHLAKDINKNKQTITDILTFCAKSLSEIGKALSIFLPSTGQTIYETFNQERITKAKLLFTKIEVEGSNKAKYL